MFRFWKKPKALSHPPDYEIVAGVLSDVGCRREINEDCGRYFHPSDPELLARRGSLGIVADGMGGHSAGEVASAIAVDVVCEVYYEDHGDIPRSLQRAFHRANREILAAARHDQNKNGMGTTCTALVVCDNLAYCAHIGDSRLYLARDGSLYQMTEDHSQVQEMVRQGLLTPEQARHHPDKNVIVRALGSAPDVEPTLWDAPFPIRNGDLFLLCSDGLYDLIEDEELGEVIVAEEPYTACERLIALAKERGGHDNITVGVFGIQALKEEPNEPVSVTREVEIAP